MKKIKLSAKKFYKEHIDSKTDIWWSLVALCLALFILAFTLLRETYLTP